MPDAEGMHPLGVQCTGGTRFGESLFRRTRPGNDRAGWVPISSGQPCQFTSSAS